MGDIGEKTRCNIAASLGQSRERGVGRSGIHRTLLKCIVDLRLDRLDSRLGYNWTDGCGLIQRVTELVAEGTLEPMGFININETPLHSPFKLALKLPHEVIVNVLMNIDPLDCTAALARVENGTVDDVGRRPLQISVSTDVGGILATKLQVNGYNPARGGLSDGQSTRSGTRKAYLLDGRKFGDLLHPLQAAGVENLEYVRRETCLVERLLEAVCNLWRLGRRLKND